MIPYRMAALQLLAGLFFGCAGICWGSKKLLKVNGYTVLFTDLPKSLDGFRILQISDLHSDKNEKMNLDIWKTIDTLDFDMAAITGDIVQQSLSELAPHCEGLRRLAKRVPTYYVDGNHERFIYESRIVGFMKEIGIRVLNNEKTELPFHGGSLEIIGTRDYKYLKKTNFKGIDALFEEDSGNFQVVLTHQPQLFDRIKQYAPDFVITGHTHGGQVRLPFMPTLFAPGQGKFPKYGDGFYTFENSKMYVSRGIGTTLFPIRFFNRPEIAVFELKRPY